MAVIIPELTFAVTSTVALRPLCGAGSFIAYCIWVPGGSTALFKKKRKKSVGDYPVTPLLFLIPVESTDQELLKLEGGTDVTRVLRCQREVWLSRYMSGQPAESRTQDLHQQTQWDFVFPPAHAQKLGPGDQRGAHRSGGDGDKKLPICYSHLLVLFIGCSSTEYLGF